MFLQVWGRKSTASSITSMVDVFYLAGFIEAWGRGYEKIRDAFKAENLEMPMFEEVRGGFMATIKREKCGGGIIYF